MNVRPGISSSNRRDGAMKRFLLMLATAVVVVSAAHAQAADVKPTEIRGHFIGETIAAFLRMEPEAQQEAEVSRQHSNQPSCARLLAALDHGQRAEISTSNSINFVLDGGKLVKLTMLVDDAPDAIRVDLTKKFGLQPRETTIPGQNYLGAKWENRSFAWDTPDAYVTLYEDNNPSIQDRRPVLVVESRASYERK